MKKDDVKAVLDRVLSWAPDDQEKVVRFVREVEHGVRTMTSAKRNGRSSRRALRGAIWRPIKRSNRCSVATGGHEAPIRTRRTCRSG
jgi:hypothetical protein